MGEAAIGFEQTDAEPKFIDERQFCLKKMKRKDDAKRVFNEEKEKHLQIESSSL